MRKRLTETMIDAFKPKATGRYLVYDSKVPGLAVRVSRTGRKTFCLIARFNSKHPTRRSLGAIGKVSLDEAREKAHAWHQQLARGSDPSVAGSDSTSFGALAHQLFVHIGANRRAWDCERTVTRELISRWNGRPVASIKRTDVLEVTDAAIARGSPYAAHHAWAYARRIFNYAIARGLLEHSPCDRVRPRDIIGTEGRRARAR